MIDHIATNDLSDRAWGKQVLHLLTYGLNERGPSSCSRMFICNIISSRDVHDRSGPLSFYLPSSAAPFCKLWSELDYLSQCSLFANLLIPISVWMIINGSEEEPAGWLVYLLQCVFKSSFVWRQLLLCMRLLTILLSWLKRTSCIDSGELTLLRNRKPVWMHWKCKQLREPLKLAELSA